MTQKRRRKTPQEKIAEAEKKEKAALETAKRYKAEIAAERAKLKKKEDSDREHKKFIIGGTILAEIEEYPNGELAKTILPALLLRRVKAPRQREFMELPPLPKTKPTPKNDNNETLRDEFPKADHS